MTRRCHCRFTGVVTTIIAMDSDDRFVMRDCFAFHRASCIDRARDDRSFVNCKVCVRYVKMS